MRAAIVPGSYDPITVGHLDLVRRSAQLFDKVYVVVLDNREKTYLFSPQERLALVREAVAGIPGVVADYDSGYTADYVNRHGICAIVRGVRSGEDSAYELKVAQYNWEHAPGADTIWLPVRPGLERVSASLVRHTLFAGGDVSSYVTPGALRALMHKKADAAARHSAFLQAENKGE